MDADMSKVEITWAALLMGSFLLPTAIMLFRFKCPIGALTCVGMWFGVIYWHVHKYGFDAVGPFITSILLFSVLAFIVTVALSVLGGGARWVSNGLPAARPRNGGRRYTVSGDPDEPPPPNPETYKAGPTEPHAPKAFYTKRRPNFPTRGRRPS